MIRFHGLKPRSNRPPWASHGSGTRPWTLADMTGAAEYWPLSEASGVRTGVITGATLAESGGTVGTGTGRFGTGTAALFSGANLRQATSALTLMPNPGSLSIGIRVKPAAVAGQTNMIHCGSASENYNLLHVDGGLSVWNSPGAAGALGPTMAAGTWYDLVATYRTSDRAVRLYRDGIQVGTGTGIIDAWATAGQFVLGSRQDGAEAFAGLLQDVVIAHAEWGLRDRLRHLTASDLKNLIVFCGDSITEASYLSVGQGFPYLIGSSLGAPLIYRVSSVTKTLTPGSGSWAIINDGASGQGLQYHISSSPTDWSHWADAAWSKSIGFICVGGNDLDVLGRTAAQVLADMQTLGNAMKAAGLGKVVVCDVADRTSYAAGEQADRGTVNASLASSFGGATSHPRLFASGGAAWADYLFRWSLTPGATNPADVSQFGDGIHPTAAVQALYAADIGSAIPLI